MYYNYEMSLIHNSYTLKYKNFGSYKGFLEYVSCLLEYVKVKIIKKNRKYFEIQTETGQKHKLLITESTENFEIGNFYDIPVILLQYEPERANHRLIYTYVYVNDYILEETNKFRKERQKIINKNLRKKKSNH